MKIKISDIKIKDRIREDIGDITQLRISMSARGLLNPIIIDSNNELISGYRRLQAAKELNWETIDCRRIHVSSNYEKLVIEAEENLGRKDFTEKELSKYITEKEYLSARGFKKFILFIKRLIVKIKILVNKLFN